MCVLNALDGATDMTEKLINGTDPLSLLLSRLSPPSTPREDQPLFADEDGAPTPAQNTETSCSHAGTSSSPTQDAVRSTPKASWALPPQYTQQQQQPPRLAPSAPVQAASSQPQEQEQPLDPQMQVLTPSSVPATPPVPHPPAAPLRTPVSGAAPPGEPVPVEDVKLLSGEQIGANVMHVSLLTVHGVSLPGQLIISTYQVMFLPYYQMRPPVTAHLGTQYFRIPLCSIDRLERESRRTGREALMILTITAKDGRNLRIVIREGGGEANPENIFQLIYAYAFPHDLYRYLFCFAHHKALLSKGDRGLVGPEGWAVYGIESEFERQGVLHARSPWRLSGINSSYEVCSAYPPVLVVPKDMSDEELSLSANFRSEGRLPVLTWGKGDSSASLWRSSQPKVGMARASSPEDEKLLRLIGLGDLGINPPSAQDGQSTRLGTGILRIIDCRHRTAAMANRATGHGYESTTNYPTSSLNFYNIGNIHVMRESLTKLLAVIHSPAPQDVDWTTMIENSRWLTHNRLLLNAAFRAAHHVHREQASVLVHCSHGWDRTAQVVALAQLMLDPYYRTLDGFIVLIEKDWLSFGHPFQLRSGHGQDRATRSDDQLAPIFLQFLDCTWQLVQQYPGLFEFNERVLLCMADHLYDCRFGNFLCNSSKERGQHGLHETTVSLWQYIKENGERFLNPVYNRGLHCDPNRILDSPLPLLLRRVTLWSDYFLRWSARPSIPVDWYRKTWRLESDPIADVDRYVPWMAFEAAGRSRRPSLPPPCEDGLLVEGEGSDDEEEKEEDTAFQTLEEAISEVRRLRALVKERDQMLREVRAGGQWLPTGDHAEETQVQEPFMWYQGAPEALLFD